MKYLICFLIGFILMAFVSFIRSIYYRRKLADKMVKVVPLNKKYRSYIYIIVLTAFVFVHRSYNYGAHIKSGDIVHAENDLCLIIMSGISFIYFILIILNSKYVYITDKMILFPDCVRKSEDYQYHLSESTLEFCPVKPPRKLQTYFIEENEKLLKEILAENYQMIEE